MIVRRIKFWLLEFNFVWWTFHSSIVYSLDYSIFILFCFVSFFYFSVRTRIQLSNEAFHMPNSFRRWIVQFSLLSESIQMSAVQLFSIWFVKINWPSNQAEECEQTASVWATVLYPVRDLTYILVRFPKIIVILSQFELRFINKYSVFDIQSILNICNSLWKQTLTVVDQRPATIDHIERYQIFLAISCNCKIYDKFQSPSDWMSFFIERNCMKFSKNA